MPVITTSECLVLSVYVCPVCALTFENLNLETSLFVCGTSAEYLVKVVYQGLQFKVRSQEQKMGFASINKYTFDGGSASIK